MRCDRVKCVKQQMKDQMDRMAGHHKVNERGAKIEKMLNRMHRKPGPRPHICIAVMQGMKPVQVAGMQDPVDPVELKAFPNWDQQEKGYEPDRSIRPEPKGGIAVCVAPPDERFV